MTSGTSLARGIGWLRQGLGVVVFALGMSTAGLLHAQEAAAVNGQAPVSDPLESWNRSVFGFNRTIDNHVFKPVATVYREVLPSPLQTGVGHFFANLREIWSAANNVFQLRPDEAFVNLTRVGINTTVGIYGVFDVASLMGIQPLPKRDFGETLGRWGVPSGPYLMLPVLGPSSLRDISNDIVVANYPTWSPDHVNEELSAKILNGIHQRAGLLDASNALEQVALDPYAMVRDAYVRARENKIQKGGSAWTFPSARP